MDYSGLPQWLSRKNLPASAGGVGSILGWEDPLKREMATHSSILAWEIPQTEEPGGLQTLGHERIRHDLETKQQQTGSQSFLPSVPSGRAPAARDALGSTSYFVLNFLAAPQSLQGLSSLIKDLTQALGRDSSEA